MFFPCAHFTQKPCLKQFLQIRAPHMLQLNITAPRLQRSQRPVKFTIIQISLKANINISKIHVIYIEYCNLAIRFFSLKTTDLKGVLYLIIHMQYREKARFALRPLTKDEGGMADRREIYPVRGNLLVGLAAPLSHVEHDNGSYTF